MELQDNKYILERVAEQLVKDDWSMEKLATARVKELTDYKGVGNFTARKIISEARELVNKAKLQEAALPEPPQETEEPPMSVRLRRLKEANRE